MSSKLEYMIPAVVLYKGSNIFYVFICITIVIEENKMAAVKHSDGRIVEPPTSRSSNRETYELGTYN